jgi:hypothetical protein
MVRDARPYTSAERDKYRDGFALPRRPSMPSFGTHSNLPSNISAHSGHWSGVLTYPSVGTGLQRRASLLSV